MGAIEKNIHFKNQSELRSDRLSAIIGADSLLFGKFKGSNHLLEVGILEYHLNEKPLDKLLESLMEDQLVQCKIAYTEKPFLHVTTPESGSYLPYYPSFENKSWASEKLTAQDVVTDYGLPNLLEQQLNNCSFPVIRHHISTVLSNIQYPFIQTGVLAYIDDGKLHICYGKNEKFEYYNVFNCTDAEDYLYYLLKVYQNFELNPDEDQFYLMGRVDSDSDIYKLVYKYFRHPEFIDALSFKISDVRFRAKKHLFFDLYATNICGL